MEAMKGSLAFTSFRLLRLCLGSLTAWAGCCVAQAQMPPSITPIPEGSFVVDKAAMQAWPRCAHGQTWDGKDCVGRATQASHREATSLAERVSAAEGFACRLPSVAELQLLLKKSASRSEGTPLPTSESTWYWTRSTHIDSRPVNQYEYGNLERGRTAENVTRVDAFHMLAMQWPQGAVRGDLTKATKLPFRVVCVPK